MTSFSVYDVDGHTITCAAAEGVGSAPGRAAVVRTC